MSESVSLTPIDDDLGDRVWRLRLQGLTNPQVARQLMVSLQDVHKALDATLPTLDHHYRRRTINEALAILDVVIGTHLASIKDPESASVVIRALCEKRFWSGVVGSNDPVQLVKDSDPKRGKSTDAYERSLKALGKQIENGLFAGHKPEEPKP